MSKTLSLTISNHLMFLNNIKILAG